MRVWRRATYLSLCVFLSMINVSKAGCADYFQETAYWVKMTKNGTRLTEMVKLNKTKNPEDAIECALMVYADVDNKHEELYKVWDDCFDNRNENIDKCVGSTHDEIPFYHFICMVAEVSKVPAKACKYNKIDCPQRLGKANQTKTSTISTKILPPTTTAPTATSPTTAATTAPTATSPTTAATTATSPTTAATTSPTTTATTSPTTTATSPTTTTLPPMTPTEALTQRTTTQPPVTIKQSAVPGSNDNIFQKLFLLSVILNVISLAASLYMCHKVRSLKREPCGSTVLNGGYVQSEAEPAQEELQTPLADGHRHETLNLTQKTASFSVITHSDDMTNTVGNNMLY